MAKKRRLPKRAQQVQKSAISPVMIAGVVIGALVLVGGLIYLGTLGNRPTEPVDISRFPTLGQPDAPVTMIEYSDYG